MKRLLAGTMAFGLFCAMAVAQTSTPAQNPNTHERNQENAQEKASGIADTVDITSGPTVENIMPTSASLAWQTNKNAATRVRYGTEQQNPSQHAYMPGGARDHRVQLTNLKPHTTYYYEIENKGGKDRLKGSFQTP